MTACYGRHTSTPRRESESEMDEQDGKTKGAAVCTLIFKKAQNEWHVQRGKPQQSKCISECDCPVLPTKKSDFSA